MKDLLEMEDMFLPFDYTKHQKINNNNNNIAVIDADVEENETSTILEERRNSLTPSNLLRRVGGALDQNRYKSQGYLELSTEVIALEEDSPINNKIK
jgi:hypothetical protein